MVPFLSFLILDSILSLPVNWGMLNNNYEGTRLFHLDIDYHKAYLLRDRYTVTHFELASYASRVNLSHTITYV